MCPDLINRWILKKPGRLLTKVLEVTACHVLQRFQNLEIMFQLDGRRTAHQRPKAEHKRPPPGVKDKMLRQGPVKCALCSLISVETGCSATTPRQGSEWGGHSGRPRPGPGSDVVSGAASAAPTAGRIYLKTLRPSCCEAGRTPHQPPKRASRGGGVGGRPEVGEQECRAATGAAIDSSLQSGVDDQQLPKGAGWGEAASHTR
jgi:hypothetical protein